MALAREVPSVVRAVVLAVGVAALVSGCSTVREPMAETLPPLIEERVPGAYDASFQEGSTSSPGLSDIRVSFFLDERPVTGDDIAAVIDAIIETDSLVAVGRVSIRVWTDEEDSGDLGCVDLAPVLDEIGLGDWVFRATNDECGRLLIDYDRLRDWRDGR